MKSMVCAGVLLALCVAPALAADVPEAARREIKAANDAWLPALLRQDAAAVAEPYAPDSVFVTATGAIAAGPAGVEKLMRERFAAARIVGGALTQDGLRMEGALIYEWGHADMKIAAPGGSTTTSTGRYLTVWKRDAAGRWRIIRNLSLVD